MGQEKGELHQASVDDVPHGRQVNQNQRENSKKRDMA